MSNAYPNIVGYLRQAASDERMRKAAAAVFQEMIGRGLRRQDRRGLRISDVGSCRRELWYKEHGLEDIPIDPIDMQLTRFDEGSLNGAWAACLIAEAATADGWGVALEEEVDFGGVPGHIDLRMWRAEAPNSWGTRSHVVEIKTKYESKPIKNPEQDFFFQILQAGAYCWPDEEHKRSQSFTLLVLSPSADKGGRAAQFRFPAEPYHSLVADDFWRLSEHLKDEAPPEGDPREKWRCYTCRASACSFNKNKLQNDVEVLFS